jgi:NAD-dependent dihydropyrimidine dehydrogenase PreA subunit
MGWAVDQLPQVEAAPLPVGGMFERIPHHHVVQPLRRRAFFGEIASRIASSADESGGCPDGIPRRSIGHGQAPGLVPKRQRLLGVVAGLAGITGGSVPADLFPGASVSEACANHNVCAAVCPTHALNPYTEGSVCGIQFTPENCIECGACEKTCPENAIKIAAGAAGPFRPGSERLTAFSIVVCARCGEEFVVPPAAAGGETGDEDTCPACRKDVGLFYDSGLCAREPDSEHHASLLTM